MNTTTKDTTSNTTSKSLPVFIGLKRYPTSLSDLDQFRGKMDHLEVMAMPNFDYSKLHRLDVPIMLHNMHQEQGFNPCDKSLFENNERALEFSFKLADEFSCDVIVVHAGKMEHARCSVDAAHEFFIAHQDSRIHFENLPRTEGVFSTVASMQELAKATKLKKICFDIGHAYESAIFSKAPDVDAFIDGFFALEPKYFHFAGIDTKTVTDHHTFSKNDFDFSKVIKQIPRLARITLETNHLTSDGKLNTQGQLDDITFVRKLFT